MKVTILINIILLVLQTNLNHNNVKVDIEKEFGFTASELFNYEGKSSLMKQEKIYFNNGAGYFITYSKENNDILGSILYEPNKTGWKINSYYKGSYVPFNKDEKYYFDGEFLTSNEKLKSIDTIVNTTGVTFGNVIDSKYYFPINNIKNSDYYIYSSSYMQEIKILNVPSYMNTQFNNNGCVPTTAAMFFSYLEDNNFDIIFNSLYKNLPIKHIDNTNKVNNFIKYLGEDFFETDDFGTYWSSIPVGYEKYLDYTSFANYSVYSSNNYNEYINAIWKAKNPVHVSANKHSFLGIGYCEIQQNDGNKSRFIIGNRAANNEMVEFSINVDSVRTFYFIHI